MLSVCDMHTVSFCPQYSLVLQSLLTVSVLLDDSGSIIIGVEGVHEDEGYVDVMCGV